MERNDFEKDNELESFDVEEIESEDEEVSQFVSKYLDGEVSEEEEFDPRSQELPVAEVSDDVYAEIVKNVENTEIFDEKTTRRAQYEGEQHYIDAQNPFQTDREEEKEGQLKGLEKIDPTEKKERVKTFDEIFRDFFRKILPNKQDKKSEFIRKLIADISVVVLIGCAIAFAVIYSQGNQVEKQQMGLSSQIIDTTSDEEDEKLWEDFRAKYPNVKTPEGMMAKYAYLYALNPNLAGWVSVPNSGIDVQVVQSANNSEYLKKDFYGNYSRYGCPFMDYRNDAKYLNQNTIIYGHHMSDGLVFAELSKYKTLDGFLESPIINFDTLYKSYKFKVYAVIITNSREQDDNGYIFNYTVTSFGSTENFDSYIKALDERKLYTTGVDINSGDKLLTLSTCTYEFTDARLVVIGRMLRSGETADVDTTYSVTNGNPHYPQVWYDLKGQSNPYQNATNWYPDN